MAIDAIATQGAALATGAGAVTGPDVTGGVSRPFTQLLQAASAADQTANTTVARMIDRTGEVHDAMIALQQADLMLQLTVQVRNKFVQAYQDIMRMPV